MKLSTALALRPVPDWMTEWVKPFEGCRLEPYHDPAGYPTIGHGHLLSREPWADLSRWPAIDQAEADRLLEIDLGRAARSVLRLIRVPLDDGQYGALIDFAYNCGGGNLEVSTLRRVINRGEYHLAPAQFRRWVYSRGVKLPGLVRRRAAEADLFEGIY